MTKIDPNNPIRPSKDHPSSSSSDKSRPVVPPKSDANFKKIMEKQPQKNRESFDSDDVSDEPPQSVFDLQASKKSTNSSSDVLSTSTPRPSVAPKEKDSFKFGQSQAPNPQTANRPSERMARDSNRLEKPKERSKVKEKETPQNSDARKSKDKDKEVNDAGKATKQSGIEEELLVAKDSRLEPKSEELKPRSDLAGFQTEPTSKDVKVEKPSTDATRFDFVQPTQDLSAGGAAFNLNPQAAAPSDAAGRATLIENLQALVSQVVNVKTAGQTDTMVVLENPPMFKGATVKVSTSTSAPDQWNISIAGLRPDAKAMLDQQLGQLKGMLNDKGLVVHMLTTTTQTETLTARSDAPLPNREGRGEEQPRDGRDQKREGQQGEEEEA